MAGRGVEKFEELRKDAAPSDTVLSPIHRFMRLEAAGGIVVLGAAIVALVWANSAWSAGYLSLFQDTQVRVGVGAWGLEKALILWINDLLMALFFLLVGLEVKREILRGELSSPRKAALPLAAAIGGMVVPAALYAAINLGHDSIRGWGVPMATDIAFALGVVALLGSRVPLAARVFLASLAIADDLGALLVIALFYTEKIDASSLAIASGVVLVAGVAGRLGVRSLLFFLVAGLICWYFVLKSGVHATLAGVALAAVIPIRGRGRAEAFGAYLRDAADRYDRQAPDARGELTSNHQSVVLGVDDACVAVESPLRRLEHALLHWVSFLVVPLFALANAGVPAPLAELGAAASDRAVLGIVAGLVIGKPLGILALSFVAVKLGLAALPDGVSWRQILGLGCLAGIGFTMALFIAGLAFTDPSELDRAKLGILVASVISGVAGALILLTPRRAQT